MKCFSFMIITLISCNITWRFIIRSLTTLLHQLSDFYGYFTPIRDYMPQNCSSDIEAVIAYLDGMYAADDTAGIQTLKEAFGLGDLKHVDDFAHARELFLSFISVEIFT